MPFTPSHAVVALPFVRTPLVPAAIAIGAMTPDLPLFVRALPLDYGVTHSLGWLPATILMGATQVLQVKLAPQTGDPMQRRLFLMMPIVMTFMFLGFPSGLVLYWLTNNVLTILQQGVYNRLQGSAVGGSTKTAPQRG